MGMRLSDLAWFERHYGRRYRLRRLAPAERSGGATHVVLRWLGGDHIVSFGLRLDTDYANSEALSAALWRLAAEEYAATRDASMDEAVAA